MLRGGAMACFVRRNQKNTTNRQPTSKREWVMTSKRQTQRGMENHIYSVVRWRERGQKGDEEGGEGGGGEQECGRHSEIQNSP